MKGLIKCMMTLAFLLAGWSAFAQTRTVSGVVKDSNNEPVPGAAVMVKGNTAIGTSTDAEGLYTLPGVPAGATLVYSFIGTDTQEIEAGSRPRIDVVLQESAEMLQEMVVIGYGTIKKADLTGAVSVIDSDDYKNK